MTLIVPISGSGIELFISSPIALAPDIGGEVPGSVKATVVTSDIAVAIKASGTLTGFGTRVNAINIKPAVSVSISGRVVYAFTEPTPVLPEIPAGWLDDQNYEARLIDSTGANIPFISADVRGDRNRLGEEATITLARKDWTGHTSAKTYTLQLGIRPSPLGTVVWHTLIENGILQKVTFASAYGEDAPQDTLTINIGSTWQNKLAQFPRSARIFYDPNETTVDLSNTQQIYYENGDAVETFYTPKAGLHFYDTIRPIINKALGFSGGFVTNLPNYPITRVDYPITSSYFDVIAGLTGLFDPLFYVESNTLHIINRNQATPEDFDPTALVADEYVSWQMESKNPNIEGMLLIYTEKLSEAVSSTLRTVVSEEQSGEFGTPGSATTSITRTFRDWVNLDGSIVRSELTKDERTTTDHLTVVVGDSTEQHEFDGQGKRTSSSTSVRALMPQLSGGADILTEVRREEKSFEYASDPTNPKAIYQRKIITIASGLIAVDSANEYLGSAFKQPFDVAHQAGNLNTGMTVEFGPIETVTETLTPVAKNQFDYRQETVDHIRNSTRNVISEPRSGNPSMGASGGTVSRQMLVLAEGVTGLTRTGKGIQPFSVGELPLFYALPLCKRVLQNLVNGKKEASVVVSGWHSSMKRGLAFNAKDRSGTSYGLFITEGFTISITAAGTTEQRVSTTLEASQI